VKQHAFEAANTAVWRRFQAALDAIDGSAMRMHLDGGSVEPMLAAVFIEAFWSSTHQIPGSGKLLVGVASWIAVFGYFFGAGCGRESGTA
jgi:hypothetical protein